MNRDSITYEIIQNSFEKFGYKFYTENYHVNIVGIRDSSNVDVWNDFICLLYRENSNSVIKKYLGTTDPGKYYLINPMNFKGTAILVPGNYVDAFTFGTHKNQYKCLVQARDLPVYRDSNRNLKLDTKDRTIDVGMHGIQIHRAASTLVDKIGKYSAGCQVIRNLVSFNEFISLVSNSSKMYNYSKFNYTLFTKEQLQL